MRLAARQRLKATHVEGTAKLMDGVHNILLVGLVQIELAAIFRWFSFHLRVKQNTSEIFAVLNGNLATASFQKQDLYAVMCLFANTVILWQNVALSDSQLTIERRDPHS